MTRNEFLKSLETLLAALPASERQDALDYYEEYFDAAGPDREAETIAELGSPQEVAQKILESQSAALPEAPSAPEAPVSPPRPAQKHRIHWEPIAACALLAVAGAAFLSLHAPSRASRSTAEAVQSVTDSSPAFDSIAAETDSASTVYEVSLDCMKDFSIDLDMGSVIFTYQEGLTTARIETQNADDRMKADFSFDPSGSHFDYKMPKGLHLDLKRLSLDSPFTLTVTLPTGFEMEYLDADLDIGDLDLGSLRIKSLTAELDMGDCTADALTAKEADISLDMGSFNAASLTAEKADIELDMGSLSISSVNAKEFTADTDMGDIEIGLLTGADKIDLSTDMGDIRLTANGSLPNYEVDAANDLGTLLVDGRKYSEKFKSDGPRSIILSSSMGSVTLDFQK